MNLVVTGLFDIFFVVGGIWAAGRIVRALQSGRARYGSALWGRNDNPGTFWIVIVGYAALVFGAVYGVLIPWGL